MVELAKRADGPVKLGIYVLAGGVLVGSVVGAAAGPAIKKGVVRTFNPGKRRSAAATAGRRIYTVSVDVAFGAGKSLNAGDQFHVLNEIDEGVLIFLIGADEPFDMVDPALLASVSDFEVGNEV